ncbi:MAG TPA: glycosyltransferase family 2 protein [Gemmatimonadaceae bacterium]|nr:glycosyltransferase family 2 protein [Gemmatimonadaceae bacterium]
MTTDMPTIAVVMLTLDQRETTLRALESLGPSDLARVEVLVWDNGSADGTVEAVRARFPSVHVHHSAENLGVAGGRNAGAALAIENFQPDFLCFLDNDLVLTPGYLDALVSVLLDDPSVGQVQSKLRYLDRPEVLNDGGGCDITWWLGRTLPVGYEEIDRGQRDRVTECVSCGGAMMVRTSVFQALGGFDMAFNPFGPEDLDFSLRLQRAGHRALYVPAAMAYHAVSHTFEPHGYSARYARLKAQNWIKFLRRHGSPVQQLAFFALGMPWIAVKLLVREGRKGNFGAVTASVRGLLASARRRP